MFGIIVGDVDEDDEVDPLVTDLYTYVNFDWSVHVNEILKASRADDCYDPITTSKLKIVPRILVWVVSHISLQKKAVFRELNLLRFIWYTFSCIKSKLISLNTLYLVCSLSKHSTKAQHFAILL